MPGHPVSFDISQHEIQRVSTKRHHHNRNFIQSIIVADNQEWYHRPVAVVVWNCLRRHCQDKFVRVLHHLLLQLVSVLVVVVVVVPLTRLNLWPNHYHHQVLLIILNRLSYGNHIDKIRNIVFVSEEN